MNTASSGYENAANANNRKWWQILLRGGLNRIIDKVGGELFDKYVWPYLVTVAKEDWAIVKAALAFFESPVGCTLELRAR